MRIGVSCLVVRGGGRQRVPYLTSPLSQVALGPTSPLRHLEQMREDLLHAGLFAAQIVEVPWAPNVEEAFLKHALAFSSFKSYLLSLLRTSSTHLRCCGETRILPMEQNHSLYSWRTLFLNPGFFRVIAWLHEVKDSSTGWLLFLCYAKYHKIRLLLSTSESCYSSTSTDIMFKETQNNPFGMNAICLSYSYRWCAI